MNKLVSQKNNQVVTSSRNVARDFNKNHRDVLRAIDGLKVGVAQKFADLFYKPSTSLKIEIDNVNRQLRIEDVIRVAENMLNKVGVS
jgi:phage regulator Rha-like protein